MILGVPVLNRYDLLEGLIRSAERGSLAPTEYLIIDNGGKFVPPPDGPLGRKISVQRPGRNIGVAAAWNRILRYAHGKGESAVISNDDVTLPVAAFEEIVRKLATGDFGIVNGLGWALFAQTPECTEQVGYYDESFYPAYYEDSDYDRRMHLAGVARAPISSRVEHVGWATTRALDSNSEHNEWLRRNHAYFCRKWGGPPGAELFAVPFNGETETPAPPRGPVMRWDVLNRIARSAGARRYLEIGCSDGECLRRVRVEQKWGVDPAPDWKAVKECRVFASMRSEEFFREFSHLSYDPGFDLVFIDSDHRAEVAYEEVRQAMFVLSTGGVIVLHDSSPSTESMQMVPMVQSEWTGDVWKAVAVIRKESNHRVMTVDTDYGCAVIRPSRPALMPREPPGAMSALKWSDLVERRKELLGLVTVEEFEAEFAEP
jgi:hypothetical protein